MSPKSNIRHFRNSKIQNKNSCVDFFSHTCVPLSFHGLASGLKHSRFTKTVIKMSCFRQFWHSFNYFFKGILSHIVNL